MKRVAMVAVIVALAGCGADDSSRRDIDDCSRRLIDGATLPADGCCTRDGICYWPPVYDERCHEVSRDSCGSIVHSTDFEGGLDWIDCGKQPWDGSVFQTTACPISWVQPGATTSSPSP
jgi:hypothetical protein